MLDICVAIGVVDHAAFLLLRAASKQIYDEYALRANMRLGVEDLLSRGDIISLMARNAEFVPVAGGLPGCAIMLLYVDYAWVWDKVASEWPVLLAWMQNVVCAYWPADAVAAMTAAPIVKLRHSRINWVDKLACLYDCLLDYSLRKGNTTVYHHIGRCRYKSMNEYSYNTWGFADFAKVRRVYMSAVPEFPRKYYELGAYILRTRPELVKYINARWDCDEFVDCCHEINSPTCKI